MARPLRIEFEGAFYHVTSRGNDRELIYFSDKDCYKFLDCLAVVCARHYWRIHAYCLMPNHYHLLVETPLANLSQGMHQLNGLYTQYINYTHNRCGHVFQGRFKSIVVDTERYYKTLVRYVLQNPVRAGMVDAADRYYWSSFNATVGKYQAGDWLAVAHLLSHFSSDKPQAVGLFRRFLFDQEPVTIWSNLTNQIFLGDHSFVRKQLEKLKEIPTAAEIPQLQKQLLPQVLPLTEYQHQYPIKNEAIVAAHRSGGYKMSQLARHFGIHISTVSRLIAKS